ncbi:6310_t:CDS:2 [Dentiscutata erythropus]|uniref:6310_t:CDS:1 n=1 Tax=Dentiscutata erythropus TaxID=1348616 RepID=A0A9N9AHE0_9GLOM|nr:6310_t:CDS:2 [Dentiscutata erythropus]
MDNDAFNFDLDKFRVSDVNSAYYIKEFITKQEEQEFLNKIYSVPKPKWVVLKNRSIHINFVNSTRLQNWGGVPTERGMLSEPLPSWLTTCTFPKFSTLGLFNDCEKFKLPNHCLINEYESGQGIMPHEDGPFYYPTVVTISLKSYIILDFYKHLNSMNCIMTNANNGESKNYYNVPEFSLLLEPRSSETRPLQNLSSWNSRNQI